VFSVQFSGFSENALPGKRLERLSGGAEEKCEKNLAHMAHKKNDVGTKRVTSRALVCHVAHKAHGLAHKENAVGSFWFLVFG
jgi:hypothetical protein